MCGEFELHSHGYTIVQLAESKSEIVYSTLFKIFMVESDNKNTVPTECEFCPISYFHPLVERHSQDELLAICEQPQAIVLFVVVSGYQNDLKTLIDSLLLFMIFTMVTSLIGNFPLSVTMKHPDPNVAMSAKSRLNLTFKHFMVAINYTVMDKQQSIWQNQNRIRCSQIFSGSLRKSHLKPM